MDSFRLWSKCASVCKVTWIFFNGQNVSQDSNRFSSQFRAQKQTEMPTIEACRLTSPLACPLGTIFLLPITHFPDKSERTVAQTREGEFPTNPPTHSPSSAWFRATFLSKGATEPKGAYTSCTQWSQTQHSPSQATPEEGKLRRQTPLSGRSGLQAGMNALEHSIIGLILNRQSASL